MFSSAKSIRLLSYIKSSTRANDQIPTNDVLLTLHAPPVWLTGGTICIDKPAGTCEHYVADITDNGVWIHH